MRKFNVKSVYWCDEGVFHDRYEHNIPSKDVPEIEKCPYKKELQDILQRGYIEAESLEDAIRQLDSMKWQTYGWDKYIIKPHPDLTYTITLYDDYDD